jgi:predicted nucleotidyltransferase
MWISWRMGSDIMCVRSIDEIRSFVAPIAESHGLDKVCLFGSYARGDATENSDMDFLVYGFIGKGMFDMIGLREEIEEQANSHVDIVRAEDLRLKLKMADNALAKDFVRRIKRDMVVIYDRA